MTDQEDQENQSDLSADQILANPSHPIWKICMALVAVLSALWGVQSGAI